MEKVRLDKHLCDMGLVPTRSQAESWIRMGKVTVNGKSATKSGQMVSPRDVVRLLANEQYVSRAGHKLASVAEKLNIDFKGKTVLDVGSSTGGFTEYALRHGAQKVIAVDVGTDQLHPTLRDDERIELHEKTDIRSFTIEGKKPDIIVMDVSFISAREVIPHLIEVLSGAHTELVLMIKPQFEAEKGQIGSSGVIKNDAMRRKILKDFELWVRGYAKIIDKADSEVAGSKGNKERFYLLKVLL